MCIRASGTIAHHAKADQIQSSTNPTVLGQCRTSLVEAGAESWRR